MRSFDAGEGPPIADARLSPDGTLLAVQRSAAQLQVSGCMGCFWLLAATKYIAAGTNDLGPASGCWEPHSLLLYRPAAPVACFSLIEAFAALLCRLPATSACVSLLQAHQALLCR